MKATISINANNAAFKNEAGTETARILRQLADDLEGRDLLPGESTNLRDINGNKVGRFEVST